MASRQSIIHVLEKTVSSGKCLAWLIFLFNIFFLYKYVSIDKFCVHIEPGVIQSAQKELDSFVAHTSLVNINFV